MGTPRSRGILTKHVSLSRRGSNSRRLAPVGRSWILLVVSVSASGTPLGSKMAIMARATRRSLVAMARSLVALNSMVVALNSMAIMGAMDHSVVVALNSIMVVALNL